MIARLAIVLLALSACSRPQTCYEPHVVDTYDLSPLGGGEGVFGHKIGDVIQVRVPCR
jgi:hypothetical protein